MREMNKLAAGNAVWTLQLTIGRHRPGVPEPGLYAKPRAPMTAGIWKWLTRCFATSCAMGAVVLVGELQAQDFSYTNTNGTITITGYTGPGGNVIIPGTIDGLPVTSIGVSALSFINNLSDQSK